MINTGFGSVLAYFSTIKVATVNFPHNKGAANSCPVSAYGLAALFYAFISTAFFASNTQGLLRFIAVFSGLVLGAGVFFVKIYEEEVVPDVENAIEVTEEIPDPSLPPPASTASPLQYLLKGHRGSFAEVNFPRSDSSISLFSTVSETSSLMSRSSSYSSISTGSISTPIDMPHNDSVTRIPPTRGSFTGSLLSSSPSPAHQQRLAGSSPNLRRSDSSTLSFTAKKEVLGSLPKSGLSTMLRTSGSPQQIHDQPVTPDDKLEILNKPRLVHHHHHHHHVSAKDHVFGLLTNKLFLSHFVLNAFYSAIGQVYIYSVGFIVSAQLNHTALPSGSSDSSTQYQALQVSIISFANFLGRLISGPLSDLFSKRLQMSRLWVIIMGLCTLILGQVSLIVFNSLGALSLTSLLVGISYGAIYGTLPAVLADTFGSRNFATTWALLGTGPIMIFLVLSNLFGKDYDHHSELVHGGDGQAIKMCLKGGGCYRNVFGLNIGLCALLFVGYMALLRSSRRTNVPSEVR
ncbi:DEKNAAC101608 [Brettanomyces naardenensis]|uniref:DEKNAAC101608 n=1 Tax=Brettanomyces naardenensis TaxID=13370 RepID=A0A448YID0_BRENA|nr:DEKNAAC101608 [Brettanomyces naardenensis]